MSKSLLTAKELAEYLNVPVTYIWSLARRGDIPNFRLPGGRRFVRFELDEVMSVLGQRTESL